MPVSREALTAQIMQRVDQGFQIDDEKARKTLQAQFRGHGRAFIRELVCNSLDAGATWVRVWVEEWEHGHRVVCEDNGSGMTLEQLENWTLLLRSSKENSARTVGCFGVGRAAAALEGQVAYRLVSRTGATAHRIVMGHMLADEDIVIERLHDQDHDPAGTRIEIDFRSRVKPAAEARALADIVRRYCCYLDAHITLGVAGEEPQTIRSDWEQVAGPLAIKHRAWLHNVNVEIRLGLGKSAVQEIYSHRVHICSANLLTESGSAPTLPGLRIIADGPFELVMGRHKIHDSMMATRIAREVRRTVLPMFVRGLVDSYRALDVPGTLTYDQVEALMVALLRHTPCDVRSVAATPLFRLANGLMVSLDELDHRVAKSAYGLYLVDNAAAVDLSAVGAVVVGERELPIGGADLLTQRFGTQVRRLKTGDAVVVRPRTGRSLSPAAMRLEALINSSWTDHALKAAMRRVPPLGSTATPVAPSRSAADAVRRVLGRLSEETDKAIEAVSGINWTLGHLMKVDGTAATSRRFHRLGDTIVVNLHNRRMQDLVEMFDRKKYLAAHLAVSLVINDPYANALPGLSAQARDELSSAHAVLCVMSDGRKV